MPKLKSLVADMGATYTSAYVNTPVCCPSRATIFSGNYERRGGNGRERGKGLLEGIRGKREREEGEEF